MSSRAAAHRNLKSRHSFWKRLISEICFKSLPVHRDANVPGTESKRSVLAGQSAEQGSEAKAIPRSKPAHTFLKGAPKGVTRVLQRLVFRVRLKAREYSAPEIGDGEEGSGIEHLITDQKADGRVRMKDYVFGHCRHRELHRALRPAESDRFRGPCPARLEQPVVVTNIVGFGTEREEFSRAGIHAAIRRRPTRSSQSEWASDLRKRTPKV